MSDKKKTEYTEPAEEILLAGGTTKTFLQKDSEPIEVFVQVLPWHRLSQLVESFRDVSMVAEIKLYVKDFKNLPEKYYRDVLEEGRRLNFYNLRRFSEMQQEAASTVSGVQADQLLDKLVERLDPSQKQQISSSLKDTR